jgi:hypothetical protein
MRKVYEDQDMTMVGFYQSLLEDEGIETLVKNEYAQLAMGEIPFTQVYPELWVSDDSRYQDAVELIQKVRGSRLEKSSVEPEEYPRSEMAGMTFKMGAIVVAVFLLVLAYSHLSSLL